MEPLEFFESTKLLLFLRHHKTELSCLEKSYVLLGKMRDCNLIPEEMYKKVSRIRNRERRNEAIYNLLEWFEKETPQNIKVFWKCILQETLMDQCPTLRRLHKRLMDGSYQFDSQLEVNPATPAKEKRKMNPQEATPSPKISSCKKKKRCMTPSSSTFGGHQGKLDNWVLWSEEQMQDEVKQDKAVTQVTKKRPAQILPETSSSLEGILDTDRRAKGNEVNTATPGKKKKKTKHLTVVDDVTHDEQSRSSSSHDEESPTEISSLRKKEDNQDIWTRPIYKYQLPVTCDHLEGSLHRKRLAKGLPCILSNKQWFTPAKFEEAGGKKSCKNWKTSIRCQNVTLATLIKDGHLLCVRFKRSLQKTNDSVQRKVMLADTKTVFEVTCGDLSGELHTQRFASGSCGMSIRTEERWMTPDEFVKAASHVASPAWRDDIRWEGKPLSVLVQREILRVHPTPECCCALCNPSDEDLESQRNDDKCCVCKCETEEQLVVCDQCPRAFHQLCHLPWVDDSTLGDDKEWLCTFCIFKNFQDWCFPNETKTEKAELLGNKISDYMMQCQYLLLYLCSSDENQVLPEYKMQLSRRLQNNEVKTIGEFEKEVKFLFNNCNSTHQGQKEPRNTCAKLQKMFNREFEEVFHVLNSDNSLTSFPS